MRQEAMDAETVELEAYVNGLSSQDKVEAKSYLRAALSSHLKVHHLGQQGGLLEEQVTRAHLESLIPDERTALAYLVALKERDPEIREIEGEKRDVARRLVDPSSRRGKLHLELLERIWGEQECSTGDEAEFAARSIHWGDPNDTFDTWAEAELTRARMQDFIKRLSPVDPSARRSLIEGTKLEGTRLPLRKWIIASALVSQARRSPTPRTLSYILPSRTTANGVLGKMRMAMVNEMRAMVAIGNPHLGEYQYVRGLDVGYRLFFKNLSGNEVLAHRHDLTLRGIGKILIANTETERLHFAGEGAVQAVGDKRKQVMEEFGKWIHPHRDGENKASLYYYLYEFAYRYNADKKRLLGWALINGLLRSLLTQQRPTDEDSVEASLAPEFEIDPVTG